MKTLIVSMALSAILFSACNGDSKTTESKIAGNEPVQTAGKNKEVKSNGMASTKNIVTAYLQIKNALTKDDDQAAAEAGKALVQALGDIDNTSMTGKQSEAYNDIADDAKEHAEHIGANAGNIKHQREHFEMLSKDIYDLVKADKNFSQKLYYVHCPMYNDGKGGNWISEIKEIQNPYLGKSMVTCGTVKEELN